MKKKYIALSDYCSSVRDGTHDTPKPTEQGKYLVTSRAVNKNTIDFSSCYFISENDFEKINKRSLVEQWDVIMTMIGSVGRLLLVKDKPDYAIKNMALFKIGDEMRAKWLYYYLSNNSVQTYFEQIANGTSQHFIGLGQLRKLKIADFSKESTRIASILSAYDNLIEANSRRIKILEQMAENLYKEWFVRFRFPNYQNTPIENGIPKGWKVETIDQFCRVFTGKKDVNQTVEDGKYPFFSCSAQDFRSNDYIYEGKAILVAGNGNTGKSKFYDGKFDLYQRTYAIVCESDLIYYLFMRFKTDFEVIYAGGSRGTAIPYIVMKNITKYKFLYNKELIDKFVSIIKPVFSQINTLQLQSANLTRQRDLLLPRLMSGQLTPLTNQ